MEYRRLGSAGVKVSNLCLGAMTFGEANEKSFMHEIGCDEATSVAILNRALDAGINFIDTADVYGQEGLSERVIGKWFQTDLRRDEVVLATKFRFRMSAGPNGTGASRYRIVRSVESSLKRLQTDRIDLYQIHMQDREVPEEEVLRALDDLVRDGKVLYIGASNYAAYRLMDSLWTSRTQHLERFVTLQAQYSLVVRELEREHIPLCLNNGVGLLPWSPLASGFLSGKYHKNQTPPAGTRLDKWKTQYDGFNNDRNWKVLDAVEFWAKELGASKSQIALAWLLAKPVVTSVIFGARTLDQLDENLKSIEVKLPEQAVKALDDASAFELGYPYEFMGKVQAGW